MKQWQKALLWSLGFVALVALATILVRVFPLIAGFSVIHSQNTAKERQLLYEIDHSVFASMVRQFAANHGWDQYPVPPLHFTNNDPAVPVALRGLGFSIVNIYDDRVDVDFGGAFLSFGISVFREGAVGYGTKELGDGIWFYAEDGRVPGPTANQKRK
jgi:hypothetical protein